MSVWSGLAVEFYNDSDPLEFGTFASSMLTFLQIATFDGWSSKVVRPMMLKHGFVAGAFLVPYAFVSGVVCINVVIAIFVDRFNEEFNKDPTCDAYLRNQSADQIELQPRPHKETNLNVVLA